MSRRSDLAVAAPAASEASLSQEARPDTMRGFTLIEVTIAMALLAVGVGGLAYLALSAGRANTTAKSADIVARAAVERLEQLRALTWTSDGAAVPVSDWSSDLTLSSPGPSGGPGLGASPGDTLAANVTGYADFLDADGRWLGGGTASPAGAAWVRRWSVQALSAPSDTLLLQVVVVPVRAIGAVATVTAARAVNGSWLMDVRTRRTR